MLLAAPETITSYPPGTLPSTGSSYPSSYTIVTEYIPKDSINLAAASASA